MGGVEAEFYGSASGVWPELACLVKAVLVDYVSQRHRRDDGVAAHDPARRQGASQPFRS